MMAVQITIAEYDPAWSLMFEEEKAQLEAAIGEYVAAIEHIGSTAVPGLGAKPVIDIMIGVDSLDVADAHCIKPIVALGYEYVKAFEQEIPFRRYFRKVDETGEHTHHIHLVEIGSDWWERHLAFRDYLRGHDEVRDAYEQLKRELASREWKSRNDYATAKTDFIRAIEERSVISMRERKSERR